MDGHAADLYIVEGRSTFKVAMWRNQMALSGTVTIHVNFYRQHFVLLQLWLVRLMSLSTHVCLTCTQRKSHIHTFLSDFNTSLCTSMYSDTCSSLYWFSGTCILESQWLLRTPHVITGNHSMSSHKMILCCVSRHKCRLGKINKYVVEWIKL